MPAGASPLWYLPGRGTPTCESKPPTLKDHRIQRQAVPCEQATRRSQTESRCRWRRCSLRLRVCFFEVRFCHLINTTFRSKVLELQRIYLGGSKRLEMASSWSTASGEARVRSEMTWTHDICLTEFAAFDLVDQKHGWQNSPASKTNSFVDAANFIEPVPAALASVGLVETSKLFSVPSLKNIACTRYRTCSVPVHWSTRFIFGPDSKNIHCFHFGSKDSNTASVPRQKKKHVSHCGQTQQDHICYFPFQIHSHCL